MRRAEGDTPRRDVLDEADIIDIVRRAVEAALARKVGDLAVEPRDVAEDAGVGQAKETEVGRQVEFDAPHLAVADILRLIAIGDLVVARIVGIAEVGFRAELRSEEHTSELQSLMRISYDVLSYKKK